MNKSCFIISNDILFNSFRWNDGVLSVGKEGEPSAFLTYADPEPFGIGYFGVCTGWGASGEWLIEGKIIFFFHRVLYVFKIFFTLVVC